MVNSGSCEQTRTALTSPESSISTGICSTQPQPSFAFSWFWQNMQKGTRLGDYKKSVVVHRIWLWIMLWRRYWLSAQLYFLSCILIIVLYRWLIVVYRIKTCMTYHHDHVNGIYKILSCIEYGLLLYGIIIMIFLHISIKIWSGFIVGIC